MLNEMLSDMENYRVPRVVPRENISELTTSDEYYLTEIKPKIVNSFYSSRSIKKMEIMQPWKILNLAAEEIYIKRRSNLKKELGNISESYGFIYYSNIKDVTNIVDEGFVKNGNLNESHLATFSMGVSVCMYPDIYHPGNTDGSAPKSGILLLVKFIKGKINFVTNDPNPINPQPQYNCHITKNPGITGITSLSQAFHSTQVFLYEYNEDCELMPYPSHILPIAAVEFRWSGENIFRCTLPKKDIGVNSTVNTVVNRESFKVVNNKMKRQNPKRSSVHSRNSTLCIKSQIQIVNRSVQHNLCAFNCFIYFYLVERVIFPFMYQNPLIISDLISKENFCNEVKEIQYFLYRKICPNIPINIKKISINPEQPFYLGPSKTNYLEAMNHLNQEDDTDYKFLSYFRIVPESSNKDLNILIDLLKATSTVARVTFDSSFASQIFLIPDDNFSSSLGIPTVSISESYLHGLILTKDHPEFLVYHNTSNFQLEKLNYFCEMNKRQQLKQKLTNNGDSSISSLCNSIVTLEALKITCKDQTEVQNQLYTQIAKSIPTPVRFIRLFCVPENMRNYNNSNSNNDVIVEKTDLKICADPLASPKLKFATKNSLNANQQKRNKKKKIQQELLNHLVNGNNKLVEKTYKENLSDNNENNDMEICSPQSNSTEKELSVTDESGDKHACDTNKLLNGDDLEIVPIIPPDDSFFNYQKGDIGKFRKIIFIEEGVYVVDGLDGVKYLKKGTSKMCRNQFLKLEYPKYAKLKGLPHISVYL